MGEIITTNAGHELIVNGELVGVFVMMLDANCYGMVLLNNGLIKQLRLESGLILS